MKESQLKSNDQRVKKVINYVVNKKPEEIEMYGGTQGPYIKVYGDELKEKFNYDFIKDNLEITIFYDRKPLSKHMNIKEYYGDKIRIDIIGLNDNGDKLPSKEIKKLLDQGLNEYIGIIEDSRYRYQYGTLK